MAAAAVAHALATTLPGPAQMSLATFLLIRDLVRDLDRHPVGGIRPLRNREDRAAAAALAAAADWRRALRSSDPNLGSANIATTAADWRRALPSSGPTLGSANVAAAMVDWRRALPSSAPNLGFAPAAAAAVVPAVFVVPLRIRRRRRWRRRQWRRRRLALPGRRVRV